MGTLAEVPLRFGSLKKEGCGLDTHNQEEQQSGPRQRFPPPDVDPLRAFMMSGDAFAAAFEKIALPAIQAVARDLELRCYTVGILPAEDAAHSGALLLDIEFLSRQAVG